MDMVPISSFVHELRPLVTGFMPDLLARSVIKSAIRFCNDTDLCIAEFVMPITADNTSITVVELLESAGVDMTELSIANVVRVLADDNPLFTGTDFSMRRKGELTVFKACDELKVIVSLSPILSASSVPSQLFNDWVGTILSASAAYLYSFPDNQNGNLHQYYEREYIEGMRKAKRWSMESLPHQPYSARNSNREFF